MIERQGSGPLRALKLNLLYWLYFWNPFFVALSFVGLIVTFIFSNSLLVTAFGLGFIASLSLEVWRSYLNLKYNKTSTIEKTQDKKED